MAKTQSNSQKIGTQGENLIPYWASKHSSSAQKIIEDYGFDFSFQVYESGKFLGKTFVAQCKTVEKGAVKYLRLEKDDLFLHLTSNSPVCLLGVDLENEQVKFLFLDEALVDRYCESIKADNETLSINFDDLFGDSCFEEECKKHCVVAKRQQLLLYTAKKMMETYAPGVDVTSYMGKNLNVLNVNGLFLADFLRPSFIFNPKPVDKLTNILNPQILSILKQFYPDFNALMISGFSGMQSTFSFGQNSVTVVSYRDKSSVCYRMKSGFVLSCGDAVNGSHQLNFELMDSSYNFISCQEDCNFFDTYSNTSFLIDGKTFIDNLEEEWPYLHAFFSLAKEASFLSKNLHIDFNNFYLKHLNEETIRFIIDFLYAIASGKKVALPFVIDVDVADFDKLTYLAEEAGVLPVEFTFGNKKYLLTCDCVYQKVALKDVVHGVVIANISNPRISETGISKKFAEVPRLLIAADWPPFPINVDPNKGMRVTWSDIKHEGPYLINCEKK